MSRPVKIAGLATYVPPRTLTNADLEKLVDTSDEWILQRTGIRERHIVDPGTATSDLAKEAAEGAIRQAGLTPGRYRVHRRGHHDTRHDLSEHRLPAAAQDRCEPRVGIRPGRRLFGLPLCADDGDAHGCERSPRARAGRGRRRDVEHHRLQGSDDLRIVRRRCRRSGPVGRGAGRAVNHRVRASDRWRRRARRSACPAAAAGCPHPTRASSSGCIT